MAFINPMPQDTPRLLRGCTQEREWRGSCTSPRWSGPSKCIKVPLQGHWEIKYMQPWHVKQDLPTDLAYNLRDEEARP